jgi:transcriptional regulator PpsR
VTAGLGGQVLAPDVILMLDVRGTIEGVVLANALPREEGDAWRGRSWMDTVDEISSPKIAHMVGDAISIGVSGFRQVNQLFPSGAELPMEYTVIRLGGDGGLIAIGRNLRAVAELQARLIAAQQAVEQEYWKLPEVESRYRSLFDGSNEGVLLVRGDSLEIVEANPTAIRSFGLSRGDAILPAIAPEERETFREMLREAQRSGRAPAILLHFGRERIGWLARASSLAGAPEHTFLIQLAPSDGHTVSQSLPTDDLALSDLLGALPDAFVVIDRGGLVRHVNRAFLDLVQLGAESAAVGQKLGRWFSSPGADLPMLLSIMRRHGSARLFSTVIHGELGVETQVEVSAADGGPDSPDHIALVMRDVGRRLRNSDDISDLHAALASIMEQGGKRSFGALIKDTVGLVERYYITAALDIARGNRTATAELLGLSRQSLYKKLDQDAIESSPRMKPDPNR